MSFLKGLETFQSRMEEEQQTQVEETSVDVEVRVAEEVEAATQIVEEATSIIEDAEASDAAADDVEAVEHFMASVRKHGLTQQGLELMNRGGIFEAVSGVALPAVESLDATGRNYEAAQVALEAGDGIIKRGYEAVKKFFKMIWEKIKGLWTRLMALVRGWETVIKKAHAALPESIDDTKFKEKSATLLSKDKFSAAAKAVIAITKNLEAWVGSRPEEKDAVKRDFKDADLAALGLKWDGSNLGTTEAKFAPEEQALSASGWTLEHAKGQGFKDAAGAVSATAATKDFASAFGKVCNIGSKMVESAAKSAGESADKEKADNVRKNVSDASKIAGKVASQTGVIPRAYVSACAALRACSVKAEKKKEEETK